jgi:hypothetical protein
VSRSFLLLLCSSTDIVRVAAQWRMMCQGVFFCCCVPALPLAVKREKSVCVADEITPGLAKMFMSLTCYGCDCFEYL